MPKQLTEEQQDFWDALTLPIERGCHNCSHDNKIISCILPAALVCKHHMWADNEDPDRWEWDETY